MKLAIPRAVDGAIDYTGKINEFSLCSKCQHAIDYQQALSIISSLQRQLDATKDENRALQKQIQDVFVMGREFERESKYSHSLRLSLLKPTVAHHNFSLDMRPTNNRIGNRTGQAASFVPYTHPNDRD